ncbi:MFS transporter [Homoserinibacter sp. GY 40078]|uniref:MFS transporter n=1 Tax=Homoserinibacter sp. GY 40078 TaxID=2603275 RepID=UPI0011C86F36|nr:MFS transporter [Homoserinibacter sp. GY 40078]TXK18984.1 MFS transporter [Homoserinibacter sp. GY 40078]
MSDPTGNEAARAASTPTPPAAANTGAIAAMGLDLQEGRTIPRKQVFSWALWDWATQPFNTVILTFVFSVYLTSDYFLPAGVEPDASGENALLTSGLGWAVGAAGLLIALLAPVLGQRADASGRRKLWLAWSTAVLIVTTALLFFIEADYAFFWWGAALIGFGSVVSEIAGVNYNAMLVQVSTPKSVGRISGLGWGFGYLGGIVALTIVIVMDQADWFGLPTDAGLNIRVVALGCAVWMVIFSIPILLNVPEAPPAAGRPRVGFFASYGVLVRDIARLYREARPTFWFLLASAVFRDGLAGVFTFGAIIAATVFGFDPTMVILFGVAANLVAGVSTIIAGRFDDRFGPRAVILTSLGGLVVAGLVVFIARDAGDVIFWVFGLVLCMFVGPAQAASRSFLARVTPAGREGEIFGLYATTGRAASFLSPLAWSGAIALFGSTAWGILGIVLILLVGFMLMLLVPRQSAS